MNRRQKTAKVLIGLGCLVLAAGSGLHLIAAYPMVSAAVLASNLEGGLRNALRAVFVIIGFLWIGVAAVTMVATFAGTRTSRPIILLCGFVLLLQIPVWVGLMGWFVGNEMFLLAAVMIVAGGLIYRNPEIA